MFMLPRDEVWFPCSFPLKWKCNYQVSPERHRVPLPGNPAVRDRPVLAVARLRPAANPMDTVSPVEVWLVGETDYWLDHPVRGHRLLLEVDGYPVTMA